MPSASRAISAGDRWPRRSSKSRAAPIRSRCATARLDAGDDEAEDEERRSRSDRRARPTSCGAKRRGDILVFLPGEREIRETADLLRKRLARRPYAQHVEILPLYARLSVAEQQRVFSAEPGAPHRARDQRRRDLADRAGHPLRHRHRPRAHQALLAAQQGDAAADREDRRRPPPTSAPAAAAASPPASASGSIAEEDFATRPEFTEPEILRSSLAAVILRMESLELGDVEAFPFVEPPTPRAIADGYQLLQELGAVDEESELTPLGRELARLPLDPRIGRMILGSRRAHRRRARQDARRRGLRQLPPAAERLT